MLHVEFIAEVTRSSVGVTLHVPVREPQLNLLHSTPCGGRRVLGHASALFICLALRLAGR
jgi:hypothetical protein